MLKFRSLAVAATAMIMASSAFAFTSIIELSPSSQVAKPSSIAEVSLDKLIDSVSYDVTCTVTSDNKSKLNEAYIKVVVSNDVGIPGAFTVIMNDKVTNSHQAKVDGSPDTANILEVRGLTKSNDKISILNLDDTDSLTVKLCYATPEAS